MRLRHAVIERFFFCLVLPLCAGAQSTTHKAAPASASEKLPARGIAPQGRAATVDSIVAAFRSLKASRLAGLKSEFETTAEFESRLAAWEATGAMRKYVFVVDREVDTYSLDYDADAREMHVTIGKEHLIADTVQVTSTRAVLGTYVGTNAFGVKKTIERTVEDSYCVRLAPSSPFSLYRDGELARQPRKFEFPIDPIEAIEARAIKPYLRIALVGRISSPEATEEEYLRQPKLNDPVESLIRTRTLPFSLDELRILDIRTCRTVASYSASVDNEPLTAHRRTQTQEKNGTAATADTPGLPSSVRDSTHNAPIRVGSDVQAAHLLRRVEPIYPQLAKQAGISGTVKFTAVIGRDGSVKSLQVISGHPLLVEAARQAVSGWVYRLTFLNGEPVEVITTINLDFGTP